MFYTNSEAFQLRFQCQFTAVESKSCKSHEVFGVL